MGRESLPFGVER
jgi:hypothetical protein